jgi:hypothetical protein
VREKDNVKKKDKNNANGKKSDKNKKKNSDKEKDSIRIVKKINKEEDNHKSMANKFINIRVMKWKIKKNEEAIVIKRKRIKIVKDQDKRNIKNKKMINTEKENMI